MKQTAFVAATILCIWPVGAPAAAAGLDVYEQEATAPALTLEGLDGKVHSFASYHGKVILVNFWATWCQPCVQEMSGMQRLADTLAGRAFEILAVNVAERRKRVDAFRRRMGIEFTVLLDQDSTAFQAWQGRVLPTSYLLDPKGRIRYEVVGPMEWDSVEVIETIESMLPPQK